MKTVVHSKHKSFSVLLVFLLISTLFFSIFIYMPSVVAAEEWISPDSYWDENSAWIRPERMVDEDYGTFGSADGRTTGSSDYLYLNFSSPTDISKLRWKGYAGDVAGSLEFWVSDDDGSSWSHPSTYTLTVDTTNQNYTAEFTTESDVDSVRISCTSVDKSVIAYEIIFWEPASNNAPTVDSFTVIPDGDNDYDLDGNNCTFTWTTSDSDSDDCSIYITVGTGTPRTPTTSDYDFMSTLDDGTSQTLTIKSGNEATWVDTTSTMNFRCWAWDGTTMSASYSSDSLLGSIDGTKPTGSVSSIVSYEQTSSPLSVSATGSDSTSGLKGISLYYRYSSDNSSWGSWIQFGSQDTSSPYSWSFSFPSGTGYYEFYSRGEDNAGNVEDAPGGCDEHVEYKIISWYSSGFGGSGTVEEPPVTVTWYSSGFGGSGTVSLIPVLSFTVSTPSNGSGLDLNFTEWSITGGGFGLTYEYNVSEDNQNAGTPALNITNTGNVGLDIVVYWTSNPGSCISLKYATSNSPPNPGVNTIAVSPSNTSIITNLGVGMSEELWLWMDFLGCSAGSGSVSIRFESSEHT